MFIKNEFAVRCERCHDMVIGYVNAPNPTFALIVCRFTLNLDDHKNHNLRVVLAEMVIRHQKPSHGPGRGK